MFSPLSELVKIVNGNANIAAQAAPIRAYETKSTYWLVTNIVLMKPSAILINTGRGPLLDEQAIADALSAGKLYAVGVDVLEKEPPKEGSPLISAPRCFITPHIAWASAAARRRLIDIATQNVAAFLQGRSLNRI